MTKPFKYSLILNFALIFVAFSYLVATIAMSYKGRCGVFWFFGGQGRPCTLREYMKEELWFALIALWYVWWLVLPACLLIPAIGYLIGRLRNSYDS